MTQRPSWRETLGLLEFFANPFTRMKSAGVFARTEHWEPDPRVGQLVPTPIHRRWLRCVPLVIALLRLRGPRHAVGVPYGKAV